MVHGRFGPWRTFAGLAPRCCPAPMAPRLVDHAFVLRSSGLGLFSLPAAPPASGAQDVHHLLVYGCLAEQHFGCFIASGHMLLMMSALVRMIACPRSSCEADWRLCGPAGLAGRGALEQGCTSGLAKKPLLPLFGLSLLTVGVIRRT